jgi:hypothetical protein
VLSMRVYDRKICLANKFSRGALHMPARLGHCKVWWCVCLSCKAQNATLPGPSSARPQAANGGL